MYLTSNYELVEWTKQIIEEYCGSIDKGSDAYRFRCPICHDSRKNVTKKRGNYYFKSASYYCFNCQHSCSSYALVSKLTGKSISDVKADFFRYEKNGGCKFEYIDSFKKSINESKTQSINDTFIIPSTWVTIEDKPRQYVDERMINKAPNITKHWKLYYNTESQRLVIPWIENGKIVYYQERALYPSQQPKYLFPKDKSNRPIFGIDSINNDYPWIFYLEGALDSIWVKNGVASGSISLSSTQLDILSNFVEHQIVYFPDNPWVDKASLENIRKLSISHPNLLVWMWPKNIIEKDVNELVCRFEVPDLFYHNKLHEQVISIKKARCMLELAN